jgi:ElaB/YqjD/DUF883 family membrane-anchored ribosome-binding protein
MNDQQLEKKIRQDAAKVRKDLNALAEDSAARLSKLENTVNQATGKVKEDLTTWVDDGVSQLSDGFEKLTSDAKETVVGAAATVKKDVGHGLSQYNAKAQKVANTVPGNFGKAAARYPWVGMSIALAVGFIIGSLLKPVWQPVE